MTNSTVGWAVALVLAIALHGDAKAKAPAFAILRGPGATLKRASTRCKNIRGLLKQAQRYYAVGSYHVVENERGGRLHRHLVSTASSVDESSACEVHALPAPLRIARAAGSTLDAELHAGVALDHTHVGVIFFRSSGKVVGGDIIEGRRVFAAATQLFSDAKTLRVTAGQPEQGSPYEHVSITLYRLTEGRAARVLRAWVGHFSAGYGEYPKIDTKDCVGPGGSWRVKAAGSAPELDLLLEGDWIHENGENVARDGKREQWRYDARSARFVRVSSRAVRLPKFPPCRAQPSMW